MARVIFLQTESVSQNGTQLENINLAVIFESSVDITRDTLVNAVNGYIRQRQLDEDYIISVAIILSESLVVGNEEQLRQFFLRLPDRVQPSYANVIGYFIRRILCREELLDSVSNSLSAEIEVDVLQQATVMALQQSLLATTEATQPETITGEGDELRGSLGQNFPLIQAGVAHPLWGAQRQPNSNPHSPSNESSEIESASYPQTQW